MQDWTDACGISASEAALMGSVVPLTAAHTSGSGSWIVVEQMLTLLQLMAGKKRWGMAPTWGSSSCTRWECQSLLGVWGDRGPVRAQPWRGGVATFPPSAVHIIFMFCRAAGRQYHRQSKLNSMQTGWL